MARHSLPERPDLDQLRRQAKELRRSVLAGDGDAIERLLRYADVDPATVTLSTAQLVIAREFGSASWPRLKEALKIRPREPSVTPGLQADSREVGQAVVVDGRILESGPDPEDASRVRLVLVTALGPPLGDHSDQRELVLRCPRDMKLGTVIPHNLDRSATSA
jgi:hypothetical protein